MFFDKIGNIRNINKIINNDSDKASIWSGLNNLFTGNLDYQRQLDLQEKQQAFNAAEAQKARDWNLQLANTAYQRQAQDLKAAGFNPALMLSGSGAGGYTSAAASSSSGSSHGSGSGWSALAKIGLALAGQAMSALTLSSKTNSNLSNALNARQLHYPLNSKKVEPKNFININDLLK